MLLVKAAFSFYPCILNCDSFDFFDLNDVYLTLHGFVHAGVGNQFKIN